MTALMSIYSDDDGDRLREIVSDEGRITFLQRTPLLFAAVTKSKRREPSSVARSHLDLLHNQLLGLLSVSQLTAMFKRKASVDLRRLLEGTDPIVDALLDRMQWDRSLLMGALQPCSISVTLRDEVSQLLNPGQLLEERRPPDLLYVLLLYGSDIVTLLRPKKHSVHPIDMQLLINTVQGTQALREAGSESWLPLSLPKFAPQGFLHVYSSVLDVQDQTDAREGEEAASTLTLCFVSGNREAFPTLSQWRNEFFAVRQHVKDLDDLSDISLFAAHQSRNVHEPPATCFAGFSVHCRASRRDGAAALHLQISRKYPNHKPHL
jgi:vacuolar fusion protein MON1